MTKTAATLRRLRSLAMLKGAFVMPGAIQAQQQPQQPVAPPARPQLAPTPQLQVQAPRQPQRHVLGTGVPNTGLAAGGQKAPALPGAPGSAASNVIDMHGGLDHTGQTVDGNHAAGVRKGFKIG
jgi:hypothetical protein